MSQRIIEEIGKSRRLAILNRLKKSTGLTVREIAKDLKMSYMGVKEQCLILHRGGYVDTWPRRKKVGRPELLYRLTDKAHELFPETSNATTLEILEAAAALYGLSAPEKLLYQMFLGKEERYARKLTSGTLLQRIQKFARIRDQEECMATVEEQDGMVAIVERHSPILDLMRAYPGVKQLETNMISRILQAEVIRHEEKASGLYCCQFRFPQTVGS